MNRFPSHRSQYIHKINAESFNVIALDLFRYQYQNNSIYRQFVDALHIDPAVVKEIVQIPCLPISFFKTHPVTTGKTGEPTVIFKSSGTTGEIQSQHFVFDKELYEASLLKGFKEFYGEPSQYVFLALLPSYLERKNASLVYMAEVLMKESGQASNGFYLNEWEALAKQLQQLEESGQKTILLGVTFALLDFAAAFPMPLKETIVMETGGMKGRKKEWTRDEVHVFLKEQWHLSSVHSEYGMTELLSQAYASESGMFQASATMKVLVRDLNDPLQVQEKGSGCLNIIDLANLDSCAFIATEDLGVIHENGKFEVLGRMDHSALRGCSLMAV
ncbi:MAG TPA: hypothetical protein VL093_06615 [Flavipsychrobacter sp.]|nr:hypothetical protein [Flavipsychrobacter sp.]